MNPNINYSIFNGFYQDPRANFQAYSHTYEAPYTEEHDHQDYTFLPKTTFFDHFIGSPLDVTRQSTEATEANDNAPLTQKPISPHAIPYPKYNLQGYDHAFTGLNVKPVEMVPNRHPEGTHFHSFNPVFDAQFFQTQHAQHAQHAQTLPPPTHAISASAVKVEDKAKVVPKIEKSADEEMEEEQGHSPEVMLNAQLKSLLDSKLWSEEKDQMLLKLGAQYKCDWKKISKRFNNKKITPHFLKIRYKELTCAPLQRRVKFNHREDLMIAKYFEKYGSNWAQMAVHFKDRSAIMLKNRYYSFIRKRELLDALLQEVKEFEKNDQEVDSLKDHESERYIEMFSSQRGLAAYREDSDQALGSAEHGVESSLQQGNQENQDNHHIFGYERRNQENISLAGRDKNVVVTGSKLNDKAGTSEDKKMVGLLKARVKSLQALYLTTKAELDKLKKNN